MVRAIRYNTFKDVFNIHAKIHIDRREDTFKPVFIAALQESSTHFIDQLGSKAPTDAQIDAFVARLPNEFISEETRKALRVLDMGEFSPDEIIRDTVQRELRLIRDKSITYCKGSAISC